MNPQSQYDPLSVDVSGRAYSASGSVTGRMGARESQEIQAPLAGLMRADHTTARQIPILVSMYLTWVMACVLCVIWFVQCVYELCFDLKS